MVDSAITVLAKTMVELLDRSFFPIVFRRESAVDFRKVQLELLQELSSAGVDPELFDRMLSNELDRKLKLNFGVAFLIVTIAFTLLSYAVIIFNSTHKWGISQIAITALIIETPIQFIGLLYIIARNLFPQSQVLPMNARVAPVRRAGKRGTKTEEAEVRQT